MGSSTILDVIGSLIIAGLVTLMVIRTNATISGMTYTYGNEMSVQKNLTTVVRMIESDFSKIGYCSSPDSFTWYSWAIRSAGPHNFSFLADINRDGKMDTIKYSVGVTTDLAYTTNPRDFPLYRTVNNNTPVQLNVGLTQFDFQFYNAKGDSLGFPISADSTSMNGAATGIFGVRLTLLFESQESWNNLYAYSYWRELRLTPKNLTINR